MTETKVKTNRKTETRKELSRTISKVKKKNGDSSLNLSVELTESIYISHV